MSSPKMHEMSFTDSDEELACAAAMYVKLCGEFLKMKRKQRRPRRIWLSPLCRSRKRNVTSDMLVKLNKEPSTIFENLCQMSASDFERLLCKVGPALKKQDTQMRESIPVRDRVAVVLQYFATGDSYKYLSKKFKFSTTFLSNCIEEVSKVLVQELREELQVPKDEDEWLKIAQAFESEWNFPNCLGAIGGKHVVMHLPLDTSSQFRNYKGTFSWVLLAVVDANYCFTLVDIRCESQIKDGKFSSLFSKQVSDQLKLPHDKQLPFPSDKKLPYVFIGDSSFALDRHMLKPYPELLEKGSPQRIFNYRLSRARGVVENVFGAMASVFRIFRRPLMIQGEKVRNVILACSLLHNLMRRSESSASTYMPLGTFDTEVNGQIVPGSWRNDQNGLTSFLDLNMSTEQPREEDAEAIRDSFADYFATSAKS